MTPQLTELIAAADVAYSILMSIKEDARANRLRSAIDAVKAQGPLPIASIQAALADIRQAATTLEAVIAT